MDAQIHLFEADRPPYPWDPVVLREPRYAGMRGRFGAHSGTPAEVLAMLDVHGVHGALVVTAGIYGYDNAYSRAAYDVAPDRFRVVGLLDSSRDDVEDVVAAWAADPAYVGLRLNLESDEAVARFNAGADNRVLAAAQREELCVCVLSPGRFEVFDRIAREYPDLRLVIDHLGLFSVAMLDPAFSDTFGLIDGLLPLSRYENVSVKATSLPMLSREPYPFHDVWPHLHAVIDAFDVGRLMWGSDAIVFDHPYAEMIDFLRESNELGASEKEMLLGGSLRRIWNWPQDVVARSDSTTT